MDANALVASPAPSGLAVVNMVVVIFAPQMPVCADADPTSTSPALQCAQTIEVASDFFEAAPEPTIWFVVMVATDEVPVATGTTPAALVVDIQNSVPVPVQPNAPVFVGPAPLATTMMPVVVMVFAVQVPI
jgi:hypothetical protein